MQTLEELDAAKAKWQDDARYAEQIRREERIPREEAEARARQRRVELDAAAEAEAAADRRAVHAAHVAASRESAALRAQADARKGELVAAMGACAKAFVESAGALHGAVAFDEYLMALTRALAESGFGRVPIIDQALRRAF